MRRPEELEEVIRQLEPAGLLWEHPSFARWVGEIEGELAAVKDLPWASSFLPNAVQQQALALLGLKIPASYEELLSVYTGAHSVVHYLTRKIDALRQAHKRWEEAKQELVEWQRTRQT